MIDIATSGRKEMTSRLKKEDRNNEDKNNIDREMA
jgi:hypothetical protein